MFPTNTLSHTTIIRISILTNHYYLSLRTPFISTNCPNNVLYIRKMPCSYMAFNFHVSPVYFSLEKLSLWHLWPQHFWQLQASYLVNDPQIFFSVVFHEASYASLRGILQKYCCVLLIASYQVVHNFELSH